MNDIDKTILEAEMVGLYLTLESLKPRFIQLREKGIKDLLTSNDSFGMSELDELDNISNTMDITIQRLEQIQTLLF